MRKPRLKTRQATRGERLELKHKVHRQILKAIAARMADAPRFESEAANEIWAPSAREISRDIMGQAYGQDVYQRYGQQQQLEGTVRNLMSDNASGYAEGLNSATDSMLDDGYGGFTDGFISGLVG